MKCTTNCAQFSLYKYRGALTLGVRMDKCVATCPSGTIADPSTMECVTRCPNLYYYKMENRNTDPKCTDNCTTGYEYSLSSNTTDYISNYLNSISIAMKILNSNLIFM